MSRALGIMFVMGCSQSPAPAPPFEYKATAGWYVDGTPNVTSMTIDGQPYASGEFYMLDETFASYEDARASFVPKTVTITTNAGSATFEIDLGACENLPTEYMSEAPFVMESDEYATAPSNQYPAGVTFFAGCATCMSTDKTVGYCD